MGAIAEKYLPGRVGYGRDGFAGRWAGPTGPDNDNDHSPRRTERESAIHDPARRV
jgi:hypothetical protein